MALNMEAEELRLAASELGRITGAIDVEDVLDVFAQESDKTMANYFQKLF